MSELTEGVGLNHTCRARLQALPSPPSPVAPVPGGARALGTHCPCGGLCVCFQPLTSSDACVLSLLTRT